ncbi:MAG: hypothetical protein ACK4TA_23755 [Saprospiraceae bacterium]
MQNQFAEINRLIENGELPKAFDKAIEIADINKTYTKELRSLKARYAILEKDRKNGILEYDNNSELNRIITSFLHLLDDISEDFVNNNAWVKKQTDFFNEEFCRYFLDCLNDNFSYEFPSYFNKKDENFKIINLESKVDKDYWYIIHWHFSIILTKIGLFITKKRDFDYADELEKEGLKKHDHDITYKWGKRAEDFFSLWANKELGMPVFGFKHNIHVNSKYSESGEGLLEFKFQFKSVMYPNQDDFDNYPWEKPL